MSGGCGDQLAATEEWRPIPGFPGYEVSDLGRVLSYKRRQPRLLRGGTSQDGYATVRLYSAPQVSVTEGVHRLVCRAFHGPRPDGMEVRHLDGDKKNNSVTNLVYGTRSENQRDNVRLGVHPNSAKTHCANGHPFDAANTYLYRGRHRYCKTCVLAAKRRYRIRQALRAAGVSTAA